MILAFTMDLFKIRRRLLRKFVYTFNLYKYVDLPQRSGANKILEEDYGHAKSKDERQPLNASGEPIPWFTYPAIEYLVQLNLKDKVVLEWGAGNSSLFLSKIVRSVCSIEHDQIWYQKILLLNISNHELLYKEKREYVAAIRDFKRKFDIIIIDGILRDECATAALEFLNEDGLIVLDNSDRDPQIAKYLRQNDLIEVDMHGFGPINDYTWTTSFFFTRKFNFKPVESQPTVPIGGGF